MKICISRQTCAFRNLDIISNSISFLTEIFAICWESKIINLFDGSICRPIQLRPSKLGYLSNRWKNRNVSFQSSIIIHLIIDTMASHIYWISIIIKTNCHQKGYNISRFYFITSIIYIFFIFIRCFSYNTSFSGFNTCMIIGRTVIIPFPGCRILLLFPQLLFSNFGIIINRINRIWYYRYTLCPKKSSNIKYKSFIIYRRTKISCIRISICVLISKFKGILYKLLAIAYSIRNLQF